jgi:hypothetical protein
MLARTWEELEFRLNVLRAKQGAHIEEAWVYENKPYVCIHRKKLVSHFSWQFIIFKRIIKLVKDFWPTLYVTDFILPFLQYSTGFLSQEKVEFPPYKWTHMIYRILTSIYYTVAFTANVVILVK